MRAEFFGVFGLSFFLDLVFLGVSVLKSLFRRGSVSLPDRFFDKNRHDSDPEPTPRHHDDFYDIALSFEVLSDHQGDRIPCH